MTPKSFLCSSAVAARLKDVRTADCTVNTVNQTKGAKSVLFRTLKNDSCRDEGETNF